MTEYNGLLVYDISNAFNFFYIGDNVSNEVILDYVELVWSFYFSVAFVLLGSKLERAAAFIYNLRIFGFYDIWLMLRTNPVYVSGAFLDLFLRCIGAALLGALMQKLFKTTSVVQLWVIVSVISSYSIVLLDPWLRAKAGCADMAGPPTLDFPHGVWLDCDDWKMAYGITWLYAASTYIIIGIAACLGYAFRNNKTIIRLAGQVSVAMIAASSATTATRSLIRRMDITTDLINEFLTYCFYIFVVIFFLLQEAIYRITKHCCAIKITLCCVRWLVFILGGPLFLMEWVLYKIEQKIIEMNSDKGKNDSENALSVKNSTDL